MQLWSGLLSVHESAHDILRGGNSSGLLLLRFRLCFRFREIAWIGARVSEASLTAEKHAGIAGVEPTSS